MDAEGKLRHSSSLGAQPGCLKTSRASAPVWGWNLTVTFPSSEPGTFAGHHGAVLDPKAAETLKKPQAGAASPSSSATAPHSKGSPGISPRLSLPQKMPFPPGMHRPGGEGGGCRPRSPQPQLLPFPSTSPPSSQRLPAALMLPISCPEAPVLPPVFLTALAAPGALCGRVKGKQAAEAAPGWADSPQLPKAAVPPPPPNALLTFSPLGFQPRFSSPSRVGTGKRRAQGGGTHSSHRAHVVPLQCHQRVNTTSAIPRASLPSSAVMTSPPSDFLLFPLGSSTDTHRCTKGSHSTAKSSGKGKALSSPCEIMAQKWPEQLCVRHWVRYQ